MKKIFTLLFAVGVVGIASAQSNRFDHAKKEHSYAFAEKQSIRDQINREYDYKIALVNMNRRLNGWEKSRQINNLERQRDIAIRRSKFDFERNDQRNGEGYSKNNARRW